MANSSVVYARIDGKLKDQAEGIMAKLGITPSNAIQMLYSQIVMTESFPIDLKIKHNEPLCIDNMNENELDEWFIESLESLRKNGTRSSKDVEKTLYEKYGI